eukprot:scaffold2.g7481.t1
MREGQAVSWSTDGNRRALGREGGAAGLPGAVSAIPGCVVAVAAGGHSLAVTAEGELWTWGRNDSQGGGGGGSRGLPDAGQLGEPRAAAPPERPARLLLPRRRFTAVAAGRYHSVALDDEGRVHTFGLNDFAQLGRPGLDGCLGGAACRDPRPTAVGELPPAVAVAAGRYFSLALTAGGEVWTWGLNLCGRPELVAQAAAAGVPPARLALVAPQRVRGGIEGAKIVAADAGYVHWVGLAEDGGVWTCDTGFDGYAGTLDETQASGGWRVPNRDGELGRPLGPEAKANASLGLLPGRVPAIAARAVAAGRCFTVAALRDGRVAQWGCGVAGRPAAPTPQPVLGFGAGRAHGGALRVVAGEWSAAAATDAGRVLVWGTTGKEQHDQAPEPWPLRGQPAGQAAVALSAAQQHYLAVFAGAPREQRPAEAAAEAAAAQQQQGQQQGQQGGGGGARAQQQGQRPGGGGTSPAGEVGGGGGGGRAGGGKAAGAKVPPAEPTAAVRRAAPDIFSELGPFEAAYRNPCFRNRTTGALRCLPYASIIGVSKAGTTDLYRKLSTLPGFMESRNKGPHFWDEPHSFDWYLSLYDDVAAAVQKDPGLVTLDASSNTFTYSSVGVRGKPSPKVLLPQVLRAVQPEMRLVVMLRDPVERMHSAFWYYGCLYNIYKGYGMSAEGFHRFAQDQVKLLWRCLESSNLRQCAVHNYGPAQQLVKGIYAAFMPDWLSHYPREQFERYRSGGEREALRRVLAFLGLPVPPAEALDAAAAATANRGHRANPDVPGCDAARPEMHEETRRLLADFYRPFNEQLAELLGDPIFRSRSRDQVKAAEKGSEVSVCVLEKGAEVGAHTLSGNVLEPRALDELLPDWRNDPDCPIKVQAIKPACPPAGAAAGEGERLPRGCTFYFFSRRRAVRLPTPPQMRNKGNYVISLSETVRWLGSKAEELGVEIYPGFAGSNLLLSRDGAAIQGVQARGGKGRAPGGEDAGSGTNDVGVARDGRRKSSFQRGMALRARATLLAEGCRGSLSEEAIQRFGLRQRAGAAPPTYALGIKEVWEVAPEKHRPGTVWHGVGWPLPWDVYGGSWVYHWDENRVSLGLVVALDYANPHMNLFQEFQQLKRHPAIASLLDGGTCLQARHAHAAGSERLPPKSALQPRWGTHTAMKSGMLAAEATHAALAAVPAGGRRPLDLSSYEAALQKSWVHEELHRARNIRPSFGLGAGLWGGIAYSAVDTYLLRGGAPWTLRHRHADHEALRPAAQSAPIDYPRPDGVLTFDLPTSLFRRALAGVGVVQSHSPCHGRLRNPKIPAAVNLPIYGGPEARYCPAGVYEYVTDGPDGEPRLQINAQNCLHCKACDIKDPTQNIRWTCPEGGGGPAYTVT